MSKIVKPKYSLTIEVVERTLEMFDISQEAFYEEYAVQRLWRNRDLTPEAIAAFEKFMKDADFTALKKSLGVKTAETVEGLFQKFREVRK